MSYIELKRQIIDNNLCIGCGACASITNGLLNMRLNVEGKFIPQLNDESIIPISEDFESICPFSNKARNEDDIAHDLYSNQKDILHNEYIGYHLKSFIGHVKNESIRMNSSSGGIITWLTAKLLSTKNVDYIVHVKNSDDGNVLFKYGISTSVEEIFEGAKTKYYPIELSGVLNHIRNNPGRYVIVGLPCFIKSINLLITHDQVLKERVRYTVGLVCGHLKSTFFTEAIALSMGVNLNSVKEIDFRHKLIERKSNDYGIKIVESTTGKKYIERTNNLSITDWGHGLFKYNACDYCDDVLAETADITVGDAWLPEYVDDSKGNSIIVIRKKELWNFIEQYKDELNLVTASDEKIYNSQAGGFRHRREGLSYRLFLKKQAGEYLPVKRIIPNGTINSKRKKIYQGRIILNEYSFDYFLKYKQNGDFKKFLSDIEYKIKRYDKLIRIPLITRVYRKFRRVLKRILMKMNVIKQLEIGK